MCPVSAHGVARVATAPVIQVTTGHFTQADGTAQYAAAKRYLPPRPVSPPSSAARQSCSTWSNTILQVPLGRTPRPALFGAF
ncbi:hypothetical protein ACFU44_33635 [Nocardia rhizosphaerihabitans]|uniref:hypothetical protein n=1 Tax=Nocardia rhizosphaerihabitans TaxID=1691570 RepID=UPI0036733776